MFSRCSRTILIAVIVLAPHLVGAIDKVGGDTPEAGGGLRIQVLPEGPWGRVFHHAIFLEPTDSYVSKMSDFRTWADGTTWTFPTPRREKISEIFEQVELPTEWIDRLLASASWNPDTELTEIRPDADIVLGLSSEQRNRLYPQIHYGRRHSVFSEPYSLFPGGIRETTSTPSGLDPEIIDLIDRLTFQRGLTRRFGDIHHVLGHTTSAEQRYRVLRVLLREKSLWLRLRIDEESDLSSLSDYWSSRGRNKKILPLLESIASTSGVEAIDIAHLLPPLPRRLLNTYPSFDGWRTKAATPDCFWTAFNFFAETPSDRLFDSVRLVFDERYERASPPYQLGDLVIIRREGDDYWLHACNYLAGSLVFTKNGGSRGRPWVIQEFNEVVRRYAEPKRLTISFHRLKPQYSN